MQVIPLDCKRVKLSEINDYKSNWQHVHPKGNNLREETKVNNQRAETLKEKQEQN